MDPQFTRGVDVGRWQSLHLVLHPDPRIAGAVRAPSPGRGNDFVTRVSRYALVDGRGTVDGNSVSNSPKTTPGNRMSAR